MFHGIRHLRPVQQSRLRTPVVEICAVLAGLPMPFYYVSGRHADGFAQIRSRVQTATLRGRYSYRFMTEEGGMAVRMVIACHVYRFHIVGIASQDISMEILRRDTGTVEVRFIGIITCRSPGDGKMSAIGVSGCRTRIRAEQLRIQHASTNGGLFSVAASAILHSARPLFASSPA